jgi:hypothetical protein
VTWETLPAGWWRELARHADRGGLPEQEGVAPKHEERILYLASLTPMAWYEGSHLGEGVYYVASFGRTVVAECLDSGNALFVYSGPLEWKTVFRQSKHEALRMGARRIVHVGDWRRRLIHRLHAGQFQYPLDL